MRVEGREAETRECIMPTDVWDEGRTAFLRASGPASCPRMCGMRGQEAKGSIVWQVMPTDVWDKVPTNSVAAEAHCHAHGCVG